MFCELCARDFSAHSWVFALESHSLKTKQQKKLLVCEFDHGPFKQFVHMLQNCKIWALPKFFWMKLLADWQLKLAEDLKYVHSVSGL